MKALPIGRDNFKNIIEEDCYYVDKTLVIEEILDKKAYVTLFPRPRRFGKSLLISMIDEFFNVEQKDKNKKLFKGLYIEKSKYKKEQGKYPVIKLNFKSFQSNNWEDMYLGIKEVIRQLFESKRYVQSVLNDAENELFEKYTRSNANMSQYEQSIQILSKYLERYYGEKVILLIDEYDVPIQNGYLNGFYNEIVGFIKKLFNNCLKTNDSIKLGIMTGVLRVSKESIFSDLNNVDVYSILDNQYDEYFGFTEFETAKLLKYYGLELNKQVKEAYDGYIFGNTEIYNPWSIINYANRKKLSPYWVNTSGDEIIKEIFNKTQAQTSEMLDKLLLGEKVEINYNEKITFLDLNEISPDEAKDTVGNFLLTSGYLTKVPNEDLEFNKTLSVRIPNREVKTVFNEVIRKWFSSKTVFSSDKFRIWQRALLADNVNDLKKIIDEALNHMSFYDEYENFYHGYMLGLFVEFLDLDYIVKSNRESGQGRFDIMIISKDRKDGIIVEFKVAKSEEELKKVAIEGKNQIKNKEYYKELELEKVQNIHIYCISFYKKKCKVV